MPQRIIQAIEYECSRCGYKWISRIEKAKPRCCAKCKNPEWDSPKMTSDEKYLRYRVRLMTGTKKRGMLGNLYIETTPICDKFLYIKPRPTIEELHRVLDPFGDDYSKPIEVIKKKRQEIMLEIITEREKIT